MSFMAPISVAGFVISLASGIYILVKNPDSRFNRLLFIFAVLISYLSLTDLGLYLAESYRMAYFWVKMGFLWPLVIPVILHAVLVFTGRMNRWAITAVYVPSFIIAAIELLTPLISGGPVMSPWGWTFMVPEGKILYDLATLWGFSVGVLAILLTSKYYVDAPASRRGETLYLFTGLMIPLFSGFATDFFLPIIGYSVPSLTSFAAATGVLIIAYGVMRFKIPLLIPRTAAEDIVRTMNNFLIIADNDLNINYANPAAERITGFRSLQDMKVSDLFESNGIDWMIDSTVESMIIVHDGTRVPVVVSTGYINDDRGQNMGIIFTGSDISQIKEMEEKLRRREDRLTLLTEHMADGLGEFDSEFRFRYLSPSIEKVTGYAYEHLMGLSALEFLEYVHPDDRERIRELIIRKNGSHKVTFRVRRPDGSYRWLEYVDRPLYHDGDIMGYVFGLRDVHEHKIAEEALRLSREKFRELFRNMNSAIVALEPGEFRVTAMNPPAERMMGTVCEDVKGAPVEEALPGIGGSVLMDALRKVRETGEPLHCPEVEYGGMWFEVQVYRISTGDIVMICDDITLRKQYEDELIGTIHEKEALLREVHHRVKNNFQIISSLINLQAANTADQTALRDLQRRIHSMALVHELLYESEDISSIDIRTYIERLVSSIMEGYRSEGIGYRTEIARLNVPIETAIPLGLIINELITNSLKHAFRGRGEILIKLEGDDKYTLTVADNGAGLPENFIMEESDSLGLQLVRGLVDQLEGDLEVSVGEGTEFRIKFSVSHYKPRI